MTVGELISYLSAYDRKTEVFIPRIRELRLYHINEVQYDDWNNVTRMGENEIPRRARGIQIG
jgi:hypothetical protein